MTTFISRRVMVTGAVASAAVSLPTVSLAGGAKLHEVTIKSFAFEPEVIHASVGDTIRWTNKDLAPHTATADEFGWDTGEIGNNAAGEVIVTEGMETSYFCVFHPHMKGRLEIA